MVNQSNKPGQKFGQTLVNQTPIYDPVYSRKLKVYRPRKRPNNIKGGGGVRWI